MRRFTALLLTLAMLLTLGIGSAALAEDAKTIKVGLICIGDENDQGYTYNFVRATETAKEQLAAEGIDVEWVIKYNLIEGDPVAVANEELAEDGCAIVFNNSYGQEPAMLRIARIIRTCSSSA